MAGVVLPGVWLAGALVIGDLLVCVVPVGARLVFE